MNIKLTCFLFSTVLFLVLGTKQLWFTEPYDYIAEIKDKAKLVSFKVDKVQCASKNRTSDKLELIAKESGVSLFAHIGGAFNCEFALKKIKEGDLVKSYVNVNGGEMMSLNIEGEQIFSLEQYLEEKKSNFGNYSAIYFVIAFMFIMLFINEKREQHDRIR
ncbi:hypothetical protein [Vibrio variabilis]|uniref:hypothetical protein n=1 Tax=Vibrio variabilis TaxID=990271 RepID=UPI000DD63B15|nr:hypothetical protein [Vibrio variabilis]